MNTAEKLPEIVQANTLIGQSPMAAFEMALVHNVDLDKLERMLELQARFDAMQAKKAYTQAMADFKSKPLMISKDKENKQYKSNYTSLGNLVNSSLPRMSECGLSHNWEIDQQNQITITCVVTHNMGHSESVKMTAPPDGSGSKNPIQQIKSTITYLKAATFESIMGLASTDANMDDDGNHTGLKTIDEKQISTLYDMINGTGTDEAKFLEWLKVESVESIPVSLFNKAIVGLKAKEKK